MYYNTVTLGEKKLGLVAIRHEEEAGQTKPAMDPRPIHFVHVLDRSGSMAPHIHELIDHVQRTLALLSERDRVSVIWFSGPGQYRTLIKGARKDDDLTALLNSLRSALYTTCFSEPLAEVNQLIAELGSLAPIAVTLFTDGLPVVAWGEAEEERRALAEVRKMAGAVLAVNTVGYGPNYNQDFLRRLAGASEMGRMTHSSRIGDYYTIFERNARFFEAEAEKLDGWADDLKLGLEREIKEFDRQIKEARRCRHELRRSLDNIFQQIIQV